MTEGLSWRTSSTSIRRRLRAPARRLVMKTSADSTSRESRRRPPGALRSTATDRLPRLADWKNGSTPRYTLCRPNVARPRYGSPDSRSSTLMISAPHSPSTDPAMGTKTWDATSSTRTSASGASITWKASQPGFAGHRRRRSVGREGPDHGVLGERRHQAPFLREHLAADVTHARADVGALVVIADPAVPLHRIVEAHPDGHDRGRDRVMRLGRADPRMGAHRGGDGQVPGEVRQQRAAQVIAAGHGVVAQPGVHHRRPDLVGAVVLPYPLDAQLPAPHRHVGGMGRLRAGGRRT